MGGCCIDVTDAERGVVMGDSYLMTCVHDVCAVRILFVLLVISFSLNCVQLQAYLLSFYCMLLCFSVLPNAKPRCVSFCLAVLYCKEDNESSDLKESGEEGMFEWDDVDVSM